MNTFIIGAGFTRAVIPTSPLNGDLLKVLAAQQKHNNSAASVLRDRYKTDDIEIALTRLDCDIVQEASRPSGDNLRQRIETELAHYFCSFSVSAKLMEESPWLVQLADNAFTPGDVIISLNYDCVLEGVLDWQGTWTPNSGYGRYFQNPLVQDAGVESSPLTVLKIHGSASFRKVPIQNKPETSTVEFVVNEQFFPRSARNMDFGWKGATGPYLIAPSYVKVPTREIAYLMLDALDASTKAKNLVIIGSALRREDAFLMIVVTNFLHQPSWKRRKIIIVDPSASSIADRLKDYWVVNVSNQILAIQKPLQNSVADLLTSMVRR